MLGVPGAPFQNERWQVGANSKEESFELQSEIVNIIYTRKETTDGFWTGKWHVKPVIEEGDLGNNLY